MFTPTVCVRLAELLLAMPALEATGLLTCANEAYRLPGGFHIPSTTIIGGALRALGGVLGLDLDRAPELMTIRRKINHSAQVGRTGEIQAAIARHALSRPPWRPE